MLPEKILEQINHHLGDILKNTPLNDIEKNIKSIILALFNKLDLVTREEFDTQQKVLLATRMKLEELETIIKNLSEKLED
ncbi:MAG: accessory factor UbiK family protein [Burkholderiales bacterium]|nr:accessory factor UbiK family protein [Burkholderiales bacterium]